MYFFEKKFSRAEGCAEDCIESEVTRNPCRFNFSIQSVTVVTPSLPSALRRCFSLLLLFVFYVFPYHLSNKYRWVLTMFTDEKQNLIAPAHQNANMVSMQRLQSYILMPMLFLYCMRLQVLFYKHRQYIGINQNVYILLISP